MKLVCEYVKLVAVRKSMVSLGQRPDLNGKTERKPFDSVFKAFSNQSPKINAVDQANQTLLFLQTADASKSASAKGSDPSSSSTGSPDYGSKPSPLKLPQAFRRNPSMTSRTKKNHRKSMPVFKFKAEDLPGKAPVSKPTRRSGFISYIDSDKILGSISSAPPRPSSAVLNGPSSSVNFSSPPKPKPKPFVSPVLARTSKVFESSSLPSTPPPISQTSPSVRPQENDKEFVEFVASPSIRRIASFPASQAPVPKEKYSVSPVSFKSTSSKPPISSPLSIDEAIEASSSSSSPTLTPPSSRSSRHPCSPFYPSRHFSLTNSEQVSPPFSPVSDPFSSPRDSFIDNSDHHISNLSQSGPTSPVTGPPARPSSRSSVNQRGRGLSRHRSAVVRRKVSESSPPSSIKLATC